VSRLWTIWPAISVKRCLISYLSLTRNNTAVISGIDIVCLMEQQYKFWHSKLDNCTRSIVARFGVGCTYFGRLHVMNMSTLHLVNDPVTLDEDEA
jgi:hypothetical protein